MISLKDNRLVQKMLDRLFAALVNGPSLNARPHSSRQRIDLVQLAKLGDRTPEDVLRELLGEKGESKIVARIPPPPKRKSGYEHNGEWEGTVDANKPVLTDEEKAAQKAFADQQAVVTKIRSIAEDARVYENDTGVHVLQIGFPLLSLPPGSLGAKGFARRVLAPICFISLNLTARSGPNAAVEMECRNEGADLVQPNVALLAWLEQMAGKTIGEIDPDNEGSHPFDEISQIVQRVGRILDLSFTRFSTGEEIEKLLKLSPCPRADDEGENKAQILSSAVIGLFPLANQGLIRDTQAMLAGEEVDGPIESFVKVGVALDATTPTAAGDAQPAIVPKQTRQFADERLIAPADPCQGRAVKQARTSRGLVIHGPPGTGKSQTIANIIGDHLARGERVLFVCDKRTALDVVQDRLNATGLGQLCAVVHDPQRDQRELYRSIREQLDTLTELKTNSTADREVARTDKELQTLHTELTEYHSALMTPPAGSEVSFHELMGRWLELPTSEAAFEESLVAGVTVEQVQEQSRQLHEVFERGVTCEHPSNPWTNAAGVTLAKFMATPMDRFRQTIGASVDRATALDATAGANVPPFAKDEDVTAGAAVRMALAENLRRTLPLFAAAEIKKWAEAGEKSAGQEQAKLQSLAGQVAIIAKGPLDVELSSAIASPPPAATAINPQIAALDAYIASAASFLGFFAFGRKKAAGQVLGTFGLPLSTENATRVREFLAAVKARVLVGQAIDQLEAPAPARRDDELLKASERYLSLFGLLAHVHSDAHLKPIAPIIVKSLASAEGASVLIEGLVASTPRAKAIVEFETQLRSAEMFDERWQASVRQQVREGKHAGDTVRLLSDRLPTLENVLRIRESLAQFAPAIRKSAERLLSQSLPADEALSIMEKAIFGLAIAERLQSDPRLQAADTQRLRSAFTKYTALDGQRKAATRAAVLHLWATKQKDRLLATTGSRLNGAGADLRRRFTLRGERAMRLRQVLAVGAGTEGGDPLFDLRPVWMASPETVAQLFVRKAIFDVVVFDEASQCRLEEALPVLLRAKRVVIAGDPKQLPPSRFFESTLAASEQEEIESDQQLFEAQQGEIEDLLAAALNVEIEECYLDVHYRSRNSDLIDFSNRNFYGSRLQPIPGHPSNRARYAPLTLYHVGGTYEDRQNDAEADKVAQIVHDLLKRAEAPSIGIACFNISQRDLILDKLDELAEKDAAFGKALAEARTRRVGGAFQGLFVKNLENVQGDERDHMIISTTYGPDVKGKFYRRFGPLGQAGGARRLNVLVTRSRDEVHIVTSIPPSEYRSLPPVPPGQNAGGPWLLFSYLAEAERLGELYEQNHRILTDAQEKAAPVLEVRQTRYPSRFSKRFGQELVDDHATGATVHWGNDGFCVDVALHHPKRMEDVTIGVLCDVNRFEQAADPVEWEVFRTMVLESQNWKLHRLWTPQYFRDQRGSVDAILQSAREFLAGDTEKDAIRVSKETDA